MFTINKQTTTKNVSLRSLLENRYVLNIFEQFVIIHNNQNE